MFYNFIVFFVGIYLRVVFRVEVFGREKIPASGSYILAPNHISNYDPLVMAIFCPPHHPMLIPGKQELFQINKFVSWFFKKMGVISLARGRGDTDVLERAIQECRGGRPMMIFPEGTRSKTGELLPPKSGAFVVAGAAQTDMFPCRILYDGPGGKARHFGRVRICIGDPIPAAQLQMSEGKSAAKLRENKKLLTAGWQEQYELHHF